MEGTDQNRSDVRGVRISERSELEVLLYRIPYISTTSAGIVLYTMQYPKVSHGYAQSGIDSL